MTPTPPGNIQKAILEFIAEIVTNKNNLDELLNNLQIHNHLLRERNKELEEQIKKLQKLVPATGFEPATPSLRMKCSTS